MRFCPARAGQGILFRRVDLPNTPAVPALEEYVVDNARSTTLGVGNVRIHTVEHVLAALSAYHIDNLIIELNNIEPPIATGGADRFVQMIEEAGVEELGAHQVVGYLTTPIYCEDGGGMTLIALPSKEYRISYTLSYPHSSPLQAQFCSFAVQAEDFKRDIAPCRTFALYEEISSLMDRGLIQGGSLENAVVIHQNAVFSKGGLFFPNEMVRHKVLDVIGDLTLVGSPFYAHIIALRAGHALNCALATKLRQQLQYI